MHWGSFIFGGLVGLVTTAAFFITIILLYFREVGRGFSRAFGW